jgi:hypothetical protein
VLGFAKNALQRTVGSIQSKTEQQYVYAMEANITFKNGLSIPLLTEYLSMENNQLINLTSKQGRNKIFRAHMDFKHTYID